MSKVKTVFFCKNCGAESGKWVGKCPSCNEWNTYIEELKVKNGNSSLKLEKRNTAPQSLTHIEEHKAHFIQITDKELSRVLGGGIVPGAIVLLGGEPGIGKSTLLLQLMLQESNIKTLYVSGEESEQQLKQRALRVGAAHSNSFILCETDTRNIFKHLKELQPDLIIIDSIQTMHSDLLEASAGSISQIRETAAEFLRFAKQNNTPVFLIGHITKEGIIAGPKILEHMVDTVLQFEGDRHHAYRMVRSIKNRFGSTSELAIYEMRPEGLIAAENLSDIFITQRNQPISGNAIAATMEGIRPMFIEVQALVSSAVYGTPQRSCTGFDIKRFNMLLAVLEKRCGFKLAAKDSFLNIAGGIRIEDPSVDLAIISATLSSAEDLPIDSMNCFCGEVGLTGEIRPVSRIENRIKEAIKLGFESFYCSSYNLKGLDKTLLSQIKTIPVNRVDEVFKHLFG
ncbi:MAG TPA: DNA repair protein RadA [Bacteroidia bacterium]|nr:DNA repair protein RadA [Bacteroidia bacterium]HNT79851.1 DNA repair protein RadA [Bacteroidia bacterium]